MSLAAAAALWIAYHRPELESRGYYDEGRRWMKVEAVRQALYDTASKEFPEWKKYYGNGILRAYDAIAAGDCAAIAGRVRLAQSPTQARAMNRAPFNPKSS